MFFPLYIFISHSQKHDSLEVKLFRRAGCRAPCSGCSPALLSPGEGQWPGGYAGTASSQVAAWEVITIPAGMGSKTDITSPNMPIFPACPEATSFQNTWNSPFFSPHVFTPAPSPCLTTQQQPNLQPL